MEKAVEAIIATGCPKCGRGSDENPHDSGLLYQIRHDLQCWSLKTAIYNLAWVWTRPASMDDEDE